MATRKNVPRGVVDTSVLVAGIAGFKPFAVNPSNASALFLRLWVEERIFVWLVSEEILAEYKYILERLGVRRPLIGNVINLLREEAEAVDVSITVEISPDPADNAFCACAETGNASFIATLKREGLSAGAYPGQSYSAQDACTIDGTEAPIR